MKNNFEILSRFLERFGEEVEGHGFVELAPELKTKLQLFARGALSPSEQDELIDHLSRNPEWVSVLAATVKALRGEGSDK